MNDLEFKECESCADKPGSPELCESCLHNRQAICEAERELKRIRQVITSALIQSNTRLSMKILLDEYARED